MPPAILAKPGIAKNLAPSRCFMHHLMGALRRLHHGLKSPPIGNNYYDPSAVLGKL
jgi:hypothetical protein